MNKEKRRSFERELPDGYEQVFYLNAKDKKTGIILNLIAAAVYALVAFLSVVAINLTVDVPQNSYMAISKGFLFGFIALFAYVIIHELTHGAAYKLATGEKLTYGISWSCAFCGVPKIYVYRKYLIIACLAPFVIYSVLLLASLGICLAVMASLAELPLFLVTLYTALTVVLAMHLGGCVGDIFMAGLLLFKYKDKNTIARDTGPEQTIYVKKEENNKNENA